METRRPIVIFAMNGAYPLPLELTQWCGNCKGVETDAPSCPVCMGRGTVNTATGRKLRQFIAEQLS